MRFPSIISRWSIIIGFLFIFPNYLLAGNFKVAVDIGGPTLQEFEFVKGAIESLKILARQFDVYFLSYCGEKVEQKCRLPFEEEKIFEFIPRKKWIFVRDRLHKADEMVARKIKLLIDDDKSQVIEKSLIGRSFDEDGKQVPLEFMLFDVNSPNPWEEVFLKLQTKGYISKMPLFKDGVPVSNL